MTWESWSIWREHCAEPRHARAVLSFGHHGAFPGDKAISPLSSKAFSPLLTSKHPRRNLGMALSTQRIMAARKGEACRANGKMRGEAGGQGGEKGPSWKSG